MSKFYTIKQICDSLQVTRKTVIRWIERGELKAFKLGSGGRLWRIRERDLQSFFKSQGGKHER